MTADEILKALETSEGFYLEVGAWVVSTSEVERGAYIVGFYPSVGRQKAVVKHSLREAVIHALKDGKP